GGGTTMLAFHGSPGDYDDIILPDTPEDEFRRLLGGQDADLLAGGHVHRQFLRRLGEALFVNPGSVGLSYDAEEPDRFDPYACYAVVGDHSIEFRRAPFDAERVVEIVLASGRPQPDEFFRGWRPRD